MNSVLASHGDKTELRPTKILKFPNYLRWRREKKSGTKRGTRGRGSARETWLADFHGTVSGQGE